MTQLEAALEQFNSENEFSGKGALSLALILTRVIRDAGLPVDVSDLLTPQGGQVAGLSGDALAAILSDHGIHRRLTAEGGRTSRGSINNMRAYAAFLNHRSKDSEVDFVVLEDFWISRVREYFSRSPLELNLDSAISTRAVIRQLAQTVDERQKEMPGVTLMGTVLQHLVGAKIEVALGSKVKVQHHGASVSDQKERGGDFDIEDSAIHVTTAPTEALIAKCAENLKRGLMPVIVTSPKRTQAADGLAENAGLADRIDIVDYEQFLSTNIFELGTFRSGGRLEAFKQIISRYNEIIETYESDPSLKIAWGKG